MPPTKTSRFREALKEQYNVIGLAGAAALSAALLNPLPLLVGFAVEAAYLLFVPDSKWYETRLGKRFDQEVIARREALKTSVFAVVPARMKQRFLRLESLRRDIEAQHGANEHWFQEVVRKLDYLLEKFLLFTRKDTEFRRYLESVLNEDNEVGEAMPAKRPGRNTRPASKSDYDLSGTGAAAPGSHDPQVRRTVEIIQSRYAREVRGITADIDDEDDLNTRAVLQKRVTVLEQRSDYVGKIGKILTNLTHQMELLEDSFGLINDQMRARSPEQVLAEIEGVVYQTDSMTRLLEEMASFGSA